MKIGAIFLFLFSVTLARKMSSVSRKIINTPNAPGAIGPYSQAVQVANTVYISGSLGLIPEKGVLAEGGVKAETHQSIKNIEAILKAAGGSLNNVVSTTVLLADINDFAEVNDIYKQYFTKNYPARAAYQVAALPKGGRVEIQSIAVLGDIKDA